MGKKNIRIFIDLPISMDAEVILEGQNVHYLKNVMRCTPGDIVTIFNGKDGEFEVEIQSLTKKQVTLKTISLTKPHSPSPYLGLIFSPIRQNRLDFMIEKATELGVTNFFPIKTQFSNNQNFKAEKYSRIAIEASEQCERMDIPTFHTLQDMKSAVTKLTHNGHIKLAMERLDNCNILPVKDINYNKDNKNLMIGPEGGFSQNERDYLFSIENIDLISLGHNILRAETAAIAGLSLLTINYTGI